MSSSTMLKGEKEGSSGKGFLTSRRESQAAFLAWMEGRKEGFKGHFRYKKKES